MIYPPGQITPYGAEVVRSGAEALIIYVSHDGGIEWYLNGGMQAFAGVTPGAYLVDGEEGLHPMFTFIENKGAGQDGVTVQRTIYDTAEMDLVVGLTVPANPYDPPKAAKAMRKVVRDWIASWDPKTPGKLYYITPDMGRWWCTPRLFKAPPDREFAAQSTRLRQEYTWTIRNDDSFWRGVDSISQFAFSHNYILDNFRRSNTASLGPQWSQTYEGDPDGGTFGTSQTGFGATSMGYARWFPGTANVDRSVRNRLLGINEVQTVSINGEFSGGTWIYMVNAESTLGIGFDADGASVQAALEALPSVNPGDVTVTGSAGGPWVATFSGSLAFQTVPSSVSGAGLTPSGTADSVSVATTVEGVSGETATDLQVLTLNIGEVIQWPHGEVADTISFLARWDGDDVNPTCLSVRVKLGQILLSRFNAGVETVMDQQFLLFPPMWWETWRLVVGTVENDRRYRLYRGKGDFKIMDFKESDDGSALGPGFRGSGFGSEAGVGLLGIQDLPPSLDNFSVGDNATETQSGHLKVTNFGDQDGYMRFLVHGPGLFRIANGPDSQEFIEFGPLGDGQIALLTTLPRLRGVVDLSPDRPEQQLTGFQQFISSLLSLATNNNIPPLLESFASLFGINPPQGEMYSLLKGRFTFAIPPKPTGAPPPTYQIPVEIKDGNADSRIIAALTPLRRWPK